MTVPYDDPSDTPPHLIGTSVDQIFDNGQPVYGGRVPSSNGNKRLHAVDSRQTSREGLFDALIAADRRDTKSLADDAPVRVASFEA
jgi:hypothetical protein